MKTSRLLLMALLVFAFQTTAVQSQIKLEIGDKYETRSEIETADVSIYMGEKIETQMLLDARTEIIVKGMEDGLCELALKTTSLQLTQKEKGEEKKFDSSNEADLINPEWTELREAMNARVTLKMDSAGEVKEIEGTYDLQNLGSEKGMFMVLPESLSIGESWTSKTDTEKLKREITYTLREISDTQIVLSTAGSIEMTHAADSEWAEGIISSVGSFTGEISIDKSTFMITESVQLVSMDVTMKVLGKKVPLNTTTRIKVSNRKL